MRFLQSATLRLGLGCALIAAIMLAGTEVSTKVSAKDGGIWTIGLGGISYAHYDFDIRYFSPLEPFLLACISFLVWSLIPPAKMHGRCLECNYDLTGNIAGRCPECGTISRIPSTKRPPQELANFK